MVFSVNNFFAICVLLFSCTCSLSCDIEKPITFSGETIFQSSVAFLCDNASLARPIQNKNLDSLCHLVQETRQMKDVVSSIQANASLALERIQKVVKRKEVAQIANDTATVILQASFDQTANLSRTLLRVENRTQILLEKDHVVKNTLSEHSQRIAQLEQKLTQALDFNVLTDLQVFSNNGLVLTFLKPVQQDVVLHPEYFIVNKKIGIPKEVEQISDESILIYFTFSFAEEDSPYYLQIKGLKKLISPYPIPFSFSRDIEFF